MTYLMPMMTSCYNDVTDGFATSSVQKIADEPAIVGLENEEEEKKRRW